MDLQQDSDSLLVEGIAALINCKFDALSTRLDALEERLDQHASLLAPPATTGLCNPRLIQYMVCTFFDNGASSRGQSRFVLKVEANKVQKPSHLSFDHNLFAACFHYARFRKQVADLKGTSEETKEAILARIEPVKESGDFLFGLLTAKGGKQGTAVFATQLVVLQVAGRDQITVTDGFLSIDGEDYMPRKWVTADPKTGMSFKLSKITAKAICYPIDEYRRIDENEAYGITDR